MCKRDTHLFETLNAMLQVIVAVAALAAAFTFYRISTVKDYMVGDGKVAYDRWGMAGYKVPDPEADRRQKDRLRDSVTRRNIGGIGRVLSALKDIEKAEGYTRIDRPTGLQFTYDRFLGAQEYVENLYGWTKAVVLVALTSVFVSILSMAFVPRLPFKKARTTVFWLNLVLFMVSLGSATILIYLDLFRSVPHEALSSPLPLALY